jgi:uncharacterized protein
MNINGIGEKAFEQCAGFLRVPDSTNILDNTAVHPESYGAAKALLTYSGISIEKLAEDFDSSVAVLTKIDTKKASEDLGIGQYTLTDIITEIKKPGRDPRDEFERISFKSEVMELKDLSVGLILTGTVRNVTHFGAFVDIGVHEDGLVHVSRLSDRYVQDPFDVVKVGDIVNVEVIEIDLERKRISLSMKGLGKK